MTMVSAAVTWTVILHLTFALTLSKAKVYAPCELAETLVKNYGFTSGSVAQWVCLAKFSSGFNTIAVDGPFSDGSYSYGIFQINDKYCRTGSKSICGVSCHELHGSDLSSSVTCAKKIHTKYGFTAWPAWTGDCKGKDVSQYVKRCSLKLSRRENVNSVFPPNTLNV